MQLQDFVKVYDDVFDAETCKALISVFEKEPGYHEIHDTPLYKFHQLNFNAHKETFPIAQRFVSKLIPYYENYFKQLNLREYVDINAFEEVRLKKYKVGDDSQFKTHVDVADYATAKRFLIAIIYLNDNDGCTEFPNLNLSVQPKAGRLVLFPPSWMYPHRGLPPTDTDKYIIMTCLHYV